MADEGLRRYVRAEQESWRRRAEGMNERISETIGPRVMAAPRRSSMIGGLLCNSCRCPRARDVSVRSQDALGYPESSEECSRNLFSLFLRPSVAIRRRQNASANEVFLSCPGGTQGRMLSTHAGPLRKGYPQLVVELCIR